MIKHKEDCLSINGVQSVKVEEGTTEFKNYFKQKNIMIMFVVVLLTKLFVLMVDLVRQLLFIVVKILLTNLLKQFLRSISTAKK